LAGRRPTRDERSAGEGEALAGGCRYCENVSQLRPVCMYQLGETGTFEGGLLKIDLLREVPEAMKPRRIAINAGGGNKTIEHKLAA